MRDALSRLLAKTFSVVALTVIVALPTHSAADVAKGIAAFLDGNRILAWRELLPAARAGDPEAQFFVGTMYRHGFGTERDDAEGLYWITQAADQGYAQAEFVLGFDLLQVGNRVGAAKYIVAAATHGYGTAQYYAGLLYRDGTGVTKDPYVALGWILRAADQDVVEAQYEAGRLLANPQEGVKPDLMQAYVWFSLAADGGALGAAEGRDALAQMLTAEQLNTARERKDDWSQRNR